LASISAMTLIMLAFVPVIAISLATWKLGPLESEGVWVVIGAALALGILSAINILGSGLNSAGVAIVFVITEAIAFYANSIAPIWGNNKFQAIPYYGWIQAFADFSFGLGIYFLASSAGSGHDK